MPQREGHAEVTSPRFIQNNIIKIMQRIGRSTLACLVLRWEPQGDMRQVHNGVEASQNSTYKSTSLDSD